MNNNLIPIKRLSFIPIHDIVSFISIGNKVQITFLSTTDIIFKKGTATYSVSESTKKPGVLYSCAISCSLKTDLNDYNSPGIIIIERCGGETLVIGDPEVPAYINKAFTGDSRTVSVNHECGHSPYFLQ